MGSEEVAKVRSPGALRTTLALILREEGSCWKVLSEK